jgi:4-amino-4-deoxy-L-arabinose transferase-like glycosyltransferase
MSKIKVASYAFIGKMGLSVPERLSPASCRVDYKMILHLGLLLALCGTLYFPYLGSTPFFDKGEPREALAVQDIVDRGEWLFPLKRGELIPSKPPLFHWNAALTARVAGSLNEATIRFPSALYATFGVLLIYSVARRLFNGQVALLSGAILATTSIYQHQALNARVDMTLCFYVSLSLLLFFAIYRGFLKHPLWLYAFYTVSGIGILAKGPLGILLPALVIGAFLALHKRWAWLIKLSFHPGLLLTVLIGAGWYGLALIRGGEGFYERQIVQENLARFVGGSGHTKPPYYYVPYLFLQGLPWSIFLPLLVWGSLQRRVLSENRLSFFIVWLFVMFVFFSLSSGKRPVYLLPLQPALSVLMAAWFYNNDLTAQVPSLVYRILAVLAGVIGFVLVLAVGGGAWEQDPAWFFSVVEGLLNLKDRANLALVQNSFATHGVALTISAVLSAVLWFYLARRLWAARLGSAPHILVMLSLIMTYVAESIVLPVLAEDKSYRGFVEMVNQRLSPDDELYLYGDDFNSDPIFFYYGKPIPLLRQSAETVDFQPGVTHGYVIMTKQRSNQIQNEHCKLAVVLESQGSGPEGDAPLVLVNAGSCL